MFSLVLVRLWAMRGLDVWTGRSSSSTSVFALDSELTEVRLGID